MSESRDSSSVLLDSDIAVDASTNATGGTDVKQQKETPTPAAEDTASKEESQPDLSQPEQSKHALRKSSGPEGGTSQSASMDEKVEPGVPHDTPTRASMDKTVDDVSHPQPSPASSLASSDAPSTSQASDTQSTRSLRKRRREEDSAQAERVTRRSQSRLRFFFCFCPSAFF